MKVQREKITIKQKTYKPYTAWSFLFDCFMTILTAGLWIIWVLIREFRKI